MAERKLLFLLLSVFIVTAPLVSAEENARRSNMEITSPVFAHNTSIPEKFTCQGLDVNPALVFRNLPANARSLALIVDDPDAPMGTWVHWVVFNIPIIDRVDEDSIPGTQGINDFGREDYGGPCPPSGTHRYFFKLYALDQMLSLPQGTDKAALERAMQGHTIEKAELIGLYKKR